jgi:hypothetical protein
LGGSPDERLLDLRLPVPHFDYDAGEQSNDDHPVVQ